MFIKIACYESYVLDFRDATAQPPSKALFWQRAYILHSCMFLFTSCLSNVLNCNVGLHNPQLERHIGAKGPGQMASGAGFGFQT